jgi:hypothetical protein
MTFRISHHKHRGSPMTTVWIGLLILVIVAALGTVLYKFFHAGKSRNNITLCPGNGPLGHVVLLVDKSDPLTFTQKKDFDVFYQDVVANKVPKDHLLSVYALADEFVSTAEPLLELCNPGNGSDASTLDANPAQLRKTFDEKYLRPMLELSGDLVTSKSGKASPILEMIQLAGITGFRKQNVVGEKRMIIVSDFIQYTPQMDMYKSLPTYEAFSASSYGKKTSADLQGVKVEFHILLNTPNVQGEQLVKFWLQHIKQSGGRVVSTAPIRG